MLQCGRGPKPTEIMQAPTTCGSRIHASMWPRAEAHGNPLGDGDLPSRSWASMWPRAEAHGNPGQGIPHRVRPQASMWPRAEAHGNLSPRTSPACTATLQCGRGPKPTEMWCAMWPRACPRSFNVAAGRSPRKLAGGGPGRGGHVASMWPRAEAHGNTFGHVLRSLLYSTLQCGRGPKPTEIINSFLLNDQNPGFNVAAGRSPRKLRVRGGSG